MKPLILFCVGLIYGLGLLMIYSTTSADILDTGSEALSYQPLIRQMLYGLFSFALGGFVYRLGYRRLLQLSPYLLALLSFLLLLILIPGISREINGARRWIRIGAFSLQPSEFVKYLLPAYLIYRVKSNDFLNLSARKWLKIGAYATVPLFLILLEPNNGTVAVIGVTVLTLLLLMKIPWKYIGIPSAVLAISVGLFATQLPYVQSRLKVYLNPELDIRGRGHQPFQAKIAAGSGQLLGKGPGHSWQKLSYLPEAQNDYIAAIYGEEFGFLGILALLSVYMTLLTCGFYVAMNTQDVSAFYLASLTTFLIGLQSFLNLGVVSGLLPSTGLNLPFFSQGGSSLLANGMGIGILLSVHQQRSHSDDQFQ